MTGAAVQTVALRVDVDQIERENRLLREENAALRRVLQGATA